MATTYTKRQLHKARGIRTWYLRAYDGLRTKYTSLRTTSAKAAQEIVDRLNAARFFPGQKQDEVFSDSRLTMRDAVNRFLDNFSVTAPKSLKQYTSVLFLFADFCDKNGIDYFSDFDNKKANLFIVKSLEEIKVSTLKNRIIVIKTMLSRTCVANNLNFNDPFKNASIPRGEKREKDFWTKEEVERIVDAAPNPQYRIVWALMGFAGLRISEAMEMCDDKINGSTMRVYGKGGKECVLPISDRLMEEIELYRQENGGMFPKPGMREMGYSKRLKEACKKAGVALGSWCSNHKMRHSFSSNLARANFPVAIAQRLMRHASSQMTLDIYTHVLPDDVAKWANMLYKKESPAEAGLDIHKKEKNAGET